MSPLHVLLWLASLFIALSCGVLVAAAVVVVRQEWHK